MRKLTLELESLEVESFETADEADGRGTVAGHQVTMQTCYTQCVAFTCPECAYPDTDGAWSCDATCNNTCPETCWETYGWGSEYCG